MILLEIINFEIWDRCKGVCCVDLGDSFHKSIYLLVLKFGVDTAKNELRVSPNRVRVITRKLRVITRVRVKTFCVMAH